MKKISLFIMSLFTVGVTLAQSTDDFSAIMPTTDNNMSVVFPSGTLDSFVGAVVQAYVAGVPVSTSSEIAPDGSGGVAVIGTDNLCGCDLADGGETIEFAILMDGQIIVITDVDPPVTYAANSFQMLSGATLSFTIDGDAVLFGCIDADYLEYNEDANLNNGSCSVLAVEGCMNEDGCNYNSDANVDASCDYPADFYDCSDVCLNDTDGDGVCDELEIAGCTDLTAFNFNSSATDDDGSCIPVVPGCMNPQADNYNAEANTSVPESCEYSGINPWGPGGGTEEDVAYITSNNMSVLFPVENLGIFSGSDMNVGDVIFAIYETSLLNNEWVGFSAVDGIQSAGAVTWTTAQMGMPIFGADNNQDNGFQEAENLVWLVVQNGVIYNAELTYSTAGYDGTYENGEFIIVSSVTIGSPLYDGCMDVTAPNFDPLATTDDGSCATPYSVGCMDIDKVNYAGPGANPTHDNAENFGDAFGQNTGINLITGATFSSGIAANISDDSYCQDQVEGCTDAMAINYDSQATQNDMSICDWTLNGMTLYDVDEDGKVLATDYSFGSVNSDNVDNGIVGSDFENANILFDAGALNVSAHVIENLSTVMEWIDADEIADAQELADTLTATTNRLNDTISDMQARYDANDLEWYLTDSTNIKDAADLLAQTINDMQDVYDQNELDWEAYTLATLITSDSVLSVTNDTLDYHRAPIVIDLHTQWNTVAYYLHHESPVVAQFENQFGSETAIASNINIVKNNEGLFYWPEFNFDGIVMLEPGQGYQVRVKDTSNGKSDFIFDHSINADAYRTLIPTVPAWAIEMDVQNHPNDIRTLVRVVNMLGQEVNPADQFNGEVLLYMYNDGSVEKKMVE